MPRFALGRLASALTIAVLLAVAVAACGNDKKSSGLSDAAFVAKADPLCKPSPQGPQTRDPKAQARFARETVVPFRRRTLASIRKLEPNEKLKPKVEAYLAASEKVTGLILAQAVALEKNDRIKVGDLDVAIAQAQAVRNKAAAEVGFKKCGQPLQGPRVTAAGFESREVVVQADAACKEATDAVLATHPKDFTPPTLAAGIEKTLPAQKRALDVLRSLRTKATKPAYARFLRIEEQRYEKAQQLTRAGKANRAAEFGRLEAADGKLYEQGQPIALGLGFTICGVSSPIGF